MGIKTSKKQSTSVMRVSLKNLPTTWGLRLDIGCYPTCVFISEKPPHHMGIKTTTSLMHCNSACTLKNLPTTWGLRHYLSDAEMDGEVL